MSHDHHHANCAKSTLALAEAVCEEAGARFTPIRRRVLELIAEAQTPIGAYALIDALAADGARPAPITVYRALDFLMDRALVHRLASKNAYLACNHSHDSTDTVVLLICETCGNVGELAGSEIAATIHDAARAEHFTPSQKLIEISGLCGACNA